MQVWYIVILALSAQLTPQSAMAQPQQDLLDNCSVFYRERQYPLAIAGWQRILHNSPAPQLAMELRYYVGKASLEYGLALVDLSRATSRRAAWCRSYVRGCEQLDEVGVALTDSARVYLDQSVARLGEVLSGELDIGGEVHVDAWRARARALYELERWREVVEMISDSSGDSDFPGSKVMLGIALWRLGRVSEAQRTWEEISHQGNPVDLGALAWKWTALGMAEGRSVSALLERALREGESLPLASRRSVFANVGACWLAMGDTVRATEVFERGYNWAAYNKTTEDGNDPVYTLAFSEALLADPANYGKILIMYSAVMRAYGKVAQPLYEVMQMIYADYCNTHRAACGDERPY